MAGSWFVVGGWRFGRVSGAVRAATSDRAIAGGRGRIVWSRIAYGSSDAMIFDPMHFLFIVPGLALSLWASVRVKRAFDKYSRVRPASGLTGAQAAAELLRSAGITDVKIERAHGVLSDHYNPLTKTLALSDQVYGSST